MNRVLIVCSGGVVQDVYTDEESAVEIIDFDEFTSKLDEVKLNFEGRAKGLEEAPIQEVLIWKDS